MWRSVTKTQLEGFKGKRINKGTIYYFMNVAVLTKLGLAGDRDGKFGEAC